MREPSLSERERKPWKQLIDVHENSGFNKRKNTSSVTGNRGNSFSEPYNKESAALYYAATLQNGGKNE